MTKLDGVKRVEELKALYFEMELLHIEMGKIYLAHCAPTDEDVKTVQFLMGSCIDAICEKQNEIDLILTRE